MELENRDDDHSDRKREQITKMRRRSKPFKCCNTMAAISCSSVGLSILFACYSILGAFLFHTIEAPAEVEERMRIVSLREEQISEIAKLSEKRIAIGCTMTSDEQNRTRDNGSALSGLRELLRRYDRQLLIAVKYRDDDLFDSGSVRWSFFGSLLFSLSIMTTVGYGRVVPRTVLGKLASMMFGLLGIPLTILFLFKVGNTFADGFRIIYDKICCDLLCCKKCERDRKRKKAATSDNYPAVVAGKQRRRRRQDSVELSRDNFGFSNKDKVGETFQDQQLMIPFYGIEDVGECHTIGRRSQSSHVYESITPNEEVTSPLRGYGNIYSRQQEGSHYSKPNKNHDTRQSTLNSKPPVELKSPKSRTGDEYPRIKGIPTRDKHQPVHSKIQSNETTHLRPHGIEQKSRSPIDRSKNTQDVVSVHNKQTVESPSKDTTAEKKRKKLTGYKSPTTKSRSEIRKPTVAAAGVSRRNHGPRKSPRLAKKSPRCARAKTSSSQLGKQPPSGSAEINKHSQRILPESPSSIRRSDESFVTALDDTSSSVSSATTGSIIRPKKASSNRKQKSRAEVENYKQTDNSRTDYWLSMNHSSFADREDEGRIEWTNLTSDSRVNDGSKKKRKTLVPISVCLLVLVVYFVSGSVLFIVWEGWDYSTSFYFCFVTLTTIGFGDLVPGRIKRDSPTTSNEKLVVCVIWMTVGLCLVTMCYILTSEKIHNIKRSKKQVLKQRHLL